MQHLATAVAALSIIGMLVWLGSNGRSRSETSVLPSSMEVGAGVSSGPQDAGGGSRVPCAVPLAWRVARVDRAFGLSAEAATREIERASELWENAVGRALFAHDTADGFPVRFVFDERQARTLERGRLQSEVDALWEEVDAELAAHREWIERHGEARARHEERLRDYETRLEAHNATVRSWNERGGAPEEIGRQLRAAGEAFAEELAGFEAERRELDAEIVRLRDEEVRLDRASGEYRRRARALASAFPPESTQSGVYREAVMEENGEVVSVSREIRIYRFQDTDELRLVAAHELGHALGLGHSPVAEAVMSELQVRGQGTSGAPGIHTSDTEQLWERCPRLAPGSPDTRAPEAPRRRDGV